MAACFTTVVGWRWSNTSYFLLLGARAAATGLDLDERTADMCAVCGGKTRSFTERNKSLLCLGS